MASSSAAGDPATDEQWIQASSTGLSTRKRRRELRQGQWRAAAAAELRAHLAVSKIAAEQASEDWKTVGGLLALLVLVGAYLPKLSGGEVPLDSVELLLVIVILAVVWLLYRFLVIRSTQRTYREAAAWSAARGL